MDKHRTPGYFGPGDYHPDDPTIYPFTIDISSTVLDDLKDRLRKSRITHSQIEECQDFEYGFNLTILNKYLDYWRDQYDWREAERELNSFPNFKTEIEGLKIHFIHSKPPAGYDRVVPILASHGWPGSIHEFHRVIPILTDPKSHGIQTDIAFEVVCPSIPGYGFSDSPSKKGCDQISVARIYNTLMTRLGYQRYFVQGGDWGSTLVGLVSRIFPERVIGCHLNMMTSSNKGFLFRAVLGSIAPRMMFADSEFHTYTVKNMIRLFFKSGGYFLLQGNTPDTIGIALNDSPIGLMAWILEKFVGGTNMTWAKTADGNLERKYTTHDLITNLMIYWVNGNALQAGRFYKEMLQSPETKRLTNEYIKVPTGYAACLNDAIPALPKELAKKIANIQHYSILHDVGHFAAFEEPELLAKDVFKFASTLA
ncbi:unnamed protein product [Bursaphelenchus xylophilus]|uniref:Epoxide hydrolase n=1 Tax=Bursaphelenchus xylophilus TaxID=6326 RepID=A0A1I7RP72_BURXY|nr:unnamed protein product [Bursaphelenchus xylophilus]CAG9124629.1 unnamed protein product [Bursaphelenchus xylophilus]